MKQLHQGWTVGSEYMGGWPIYLPDGRHFCTVSRGPGFDARRFAHMIAAAPDLLAALEHMVALYDSGAWSSANITVARAAIKRATEE